MFVAAAFAAAACRYAFSCRLICLLLLHLVLFYLLLLLDMHPAAALAAAATFAAAACRDAFCCAAACAARLSSKGERSEADIFLRF